MKVYGQYMTKKKIEALKKEVQEQTIKQIGISTAKAAQDIMLASSIAILADVFGFGDKRIKRFTDAYLDLSDSLGVGTDDIETIKQNIIDNFGDVFKEERN